MIGNMVKALRNDRRFREEDIEYFVESILKDACIVSGDVVLSDSNKTTVTPEVSVNLSDLDHDVLISYALNTEDPRNTNLVAEDKATISNVHVSYDIYFTMKRSNDNHKAILKYKDTIIGMITENYNSTDGTMPQYSVTTPNNITYTSDLLQNKADKWSTRFFRGESPEQANYLTVMANILFIINK